MNYHDAAIEEEKKETIARQAQDSEECRHNLLTYRFYWITEERKKREERLKAMCLSALDDIKSEGSKGIQRRKIMDACKEISLYDMGRILNGGILNTVKVEARHHLRNCESLLAIEW